MKLNKANIQQANYEDDSPTWASIQGIAALRQLERLQEIANSLVTIRHFFHAIGTERCRLIVQEAGMEAQAKRRKRLARKRKARRTAA